jgi:hypothetical protein
MNRRAAALVLCALVNCASDGVQNARQKPQSAAEASLNFQEIFEISTKAIHKETNEKPDVQLVEEIRPSYFHIRFGLAPKGSKHALDVYFESTSHRLVKAEEVGMTELPNRQSADGGQPTD